MRMWGVVLMGASFVSDGLVLESGRESPVLQSAEEWTEQQSVGLWAVQLGWVLLELELVRWVQTVPQISQDDCSADHSAGKKADLMALGWVEPMDGVMVGCWERELVKALVVQLELSA